MKKTFFIILLALAAAALIWTVPGSADVRGSVSSPDSVSGQVTGSVSPAPAVRQAPAVQQAPVRETGQGMSQSAGQGSGQGSGQSAGRYSGGSMSVVFSPRKAATLSAEVPSIVAEVFKEFGQPFEPGETLILLDSALYRANLKQARASLAAAQSELARASKLYDSKAPVKRARAVLDAARVEYEAKAKLYQSRSASKSQVEQARRDLLVATEDEKIAQANMLPALQSAKKDVAIAEAMIEMAQVELTACNVTAPYKGRVENVLANEGEMVEPGRPLIRIIDDSVLLAKFLVPSASVTRITPGMGVTIQVNELGQAVSGTVSHVSAVLDPASNTFEVYAEIPNPDGALRSGMTGMIRNP